VAKDKLKQMAADIWEADETDLVLTSTGVMSEGREMSWREIIGKYFGIADMEVSAAAEIRQKDELAELPPFWEPAIAAVEVEVFPETGRLKVHKLVTVADVGLAINPSMAEGQDLGSATMGLGVALAEELVYDGQQLSNGSMLDYRVPRFTDVPEEFHGIIVENRDGVGPYGAKGVGDGPTAAMSAAISNAVYRAIGVRLRQAPFTPERVWRAIQEQA
jgi:CO/xanthine dehydrogenase Mo-binding subunit